MPRTIAFATLLLLACQSVIAQESLEVPRGLLGERYFRIEVGGFRLGDDELREIDDLGLTLDGAINVPLTENLDFVATVDHRRLDGEPVINSISVEVEMSATAVFAGINHHFCPNEHIDPFVGASIGALIFGAEARTSSGALETDEEEVGYQIQAGVQFVFNQLENVALTPVFSYLDTYSDTTDEGYDAEEVKVDLILSQWFNESVFGTASVGWVIGDGADGDFFFAGGFGIRF